MKNIFYLSMFLGILTIISSCATTSAPEAPIPNITESEVGDNIENQDLIVEVEIPTREPEYNVITAAGKTIIVDDFGARVLVASPLIITGKAPRNWFFEGVFPISILTLDGTMIIDSYASGDWMKGVEEGVEVSGDDMIEFSATIEYDMPDYVSEGKLQFRADNPSGMSENDDSVEIDILLGE